MIRRHLRLAFVGTLAVLLPKCLACMAGYLVVLSGLAAARPELCGGGATEARNALAHVLAGLALAVGIGGILRLMSKNGMRVSENNAAKR